MKAFRTLALALLTLAVTSVAYSQEAFTAGTWTKVTAAPPSPVAHMLLLTDGSVLVNSFFFTTHVDSWYRLVPDNKGSYVNGSWHAAGSAPAGYNPLYFGSAVLPGGNVIVMGGEYNNGSPVWTTLGAMYHPKTNTWSKVPAPAGWTTLGDAQSVVLPNGKYMQANCCTTESAILHVSGTTLSWIPTGSGKADVNDEEGWLLMPNGNVLTVDADNGANPSTYEIYNTAAGTWSSGGSLPVLLQDPSSLEIGPMILRPDGTVFAAGGTTSNAIYNTTTGVWTTAPQFGSGLDMADAPAALLPSGNVLMSTSPGVFNNGVKFFEWDGAAFHSVPGLPDSTTTTSYQGNMVCLPSGQTIFTDFSSGVYVYTPKGTYNSSWQPTITSLAATITHGSLNNVVKGTQLNGLSQCAAYGDDNQAASNFPLVRITNNATGHVFYARTHTFSTMGVATGSAVVSAQFDVPAGIELGASKVVVVANGIPSAPSTVTIN
jgi:hypothetical protein